MKLCALLLGKTNQLLNFLNPMTPVVGEMLNDIAQLVEKWLPEFSKENRSYITVAIGCTGGKHRSVYISEKLAQLFAGKAQIQLRHRELTSLLTPKYSIKISLIACTIIQCR